MKALIRWKGPGFYFKDGIADPRSAGDEDIVDPADYQAYLASGKIEVLPNHIDTVEGIVDDDES